MNNIKLAKTFGLTAALVLGASLSAMASITVNLTFTWSGSLWESGYTDSGLASDPTHTSLLQSDDAIGIYEFTTSGNDNVDSPIWSVCLSPAGLLDESKHTYNIESFSAAGTGIYPSAWTQSGGQNNQQWGVNNAAYLWSTYGMDIVNNPSGSYTGTQSQAAAALEFAIWTALYDSSGYGQLGVPSNWNWVAPTGQMDSTTKYWYNIYVSALTSSGITGPQFEGNILEGQGALGYPFNGQTGQSQEFFLLETPTHNSIPTPVPESSTMIAGALLLLPFGASTLRIFRKHRAV